MNSKDSIKVAIVDKSIPRRDQMCLAFQGLEVAKYSKEFTDGTADLVLQHYGDMNLNGVKGLFDTAQMIIFYGATGEFDTRWDDALKLSNKRKERICRKVDERTGKGALTIEDGDQLLKIVEAMKTGSQDLPDIPNSLKPSTIYPTLIALSILCQGYLAIQAPTKLGLSNMNLQQSSDINEIAQHPECLFNKIFPDINKLENDVKNDFRSSHVIFGNSAPVISLLTELRITKSSNNTEEIVENANTAICEFFDMQP